MEVNEKRNQSKSRPLLVLSRLHVVVLVRAREGFLESGRESSQSQTNIKYILIVFDWLLLPSFY